MNVMLWVLQTLLALYYLMGGGWMISKVPVGWLKVMPRPVWMVLGLLQALLALGLVMPGALKFMPMLTPISGVGLILETLLVHALTMQKFAFRTFVWVLVPGLLAAFVAYGRYALAPF